MQLQNKFRRDPSGFPDLALLLAGPVLSERTIAVAGRPTRITLETLVWETLDEAARREGRQVRDLCDELNDDLIEDVGLDTALRTYALRYLRENVDLR